MTENNLEHLFSVQNEVGEAMNVDSLVGLPAKVTVNLTKDQRGKISLNANGQLLQLLALTADVAEREEFKQGESVIIVNVDRGLAYVAEEEFV